MGEVAKVILKAPLAATIRQLPTTSSHRSLGLGFDFTDGGKLENPEKTLDARERPTTTTLLT